MASCAGGAFLDYISVGDDKLNHRVHALPSQRELLYTVPLAAHFSDHSSTSSVPYTDLAL